MSPATAVNVSEFLALVRDARPLLDLRGLLVTWVRSGCGRDDLRSILNDALGELRAEGAEDEEDLVLEALDIVEGWCSPHLKLPYSENGEAEAIATSSSNLALVLSPQSDEFSQIKSDLVLPALRESGFEVAGLNREISEADVVFALLRKLSESRIVVVDLTGLDPYIMYALGIAQTLPRPTVILTQDVEELPSDLRSFNVVTYSTRLDEIGRLKSDLQELVGALDEEHSAEISPVSALALTVSEQDEHLPAGEPEDEPLGLFELVPASLEAMEEIGRIVTEIASLTSKLGDAMTSETGEMQKAEARGGPGVFARKRQAIKVVSAYIDEYADQVDVLLPDFKGQWDSLVRNTTEWLAIATVNSSEDRDAGASLAESLQELRGVVQESAASLGEFRDGAITLRKQRLSRDLGKPLRRVENQLDEQIELLLTGASHLSRLSNMLLKRLKT